MDKRWFGKKRFGWGWGLPERWQGWVTLILYIVAIWLLDYIKASRFLFIILFFIVSTIFFTTVWLTSGKPEWGTWWNNTHKK